MPNIPCVIDPADLVAMVTGDVVIQQVDMERRTRGCDLWLLSSLLIAGLGVTSKSAVDVRVVCPAGHSEVTGVCAVRDRVHCQMNWRHWI